MALRQSCIFFFIFACNVHFKSCPEIGKSTSLPKNRYHANTTQSLLSKLVNILTSSVVRKAEHCDGHTTGLV